MTKILEGIRIISMAEQYPGPYCTLLLADMGADVLLVERPAGGDPARQSPDFFGSLNRNKRSLTLNLKTSQGVEICRRLTPEADVFLEGFRPGILKRLGLGYEALHEANSRLVYCSISGYGQDSPYRDRPAHDLSYVGLAGMLHNLIPNGNFQGLPGVAIGDLSAAMFATVGILGALFVRERTGVGQYIDVSMTDGLLSWMTTSLVPPLFGPKPRPANPVYGVFVCSDGKFLSLSIAYEDHFWRNLCNAIGWETLAPLTHIERVSRAEEIRKGLQEVFVTNTRDYWVEALAAADVASGPVLDLAEVRQHPHFIQRQLMQQVPENDGATSWHLKHPVVFSETPVSVDRPAPKLGEHTEEVLAGLGFSKEAIATLRQQNVI